MTTDTGRRLVRVDLRHLPDDEAFDGVTAAAFKDARSALPAAERNDDVAAGQVRSPHTAGIESLPLVDPITLTEAQRAVWEARLLPYRVRIPTYS